MKNKVLSYVCTCALFLVFLQAGAYAEVGFHVNNGRLYDANNNEFVMRGVSHAHTWYEDKTSAIADIKSVGANVIRIVLSSGDHAEDWGRNEPADVRNVIDLCIQNQVIAMLECHDTTGYGEKSGSVSLSTAVAYWRDLQSVLTGYEDYVLINIGNEPYGNTNARDWVQATRSAIQSMRSAGFDHTLVVDAPNWGQDWEFIMRDNAQSIYNTDTTGNTILSIHMYGVFEKDNTINNYITAIKDQGLPLVIGEFGHDHSDGDPDEDAIMFRSVEHNVGYIGWSWCGNSGGVEYLDMVNNWNVNSLTSWGDRIVNGANGLRSKAGVCSVFSGASVTPPAAPDPTDPPPSAGSCANIPEWNASTIYDQSGTRVKLNDLVYQNNWYTTGQNPEEYSEDNQVWTMIGICEEVINTTPVPSTPVPTTPPTSAPTVAPTPVTTQVPGGNTGDVNGDGIVDIVDGLLVAQYYVDLNPTDFNVSVADTNCNGSVDIIDALLIAQYYVSLIPGFDC
ncbi:MAG: cellulase family glycosylhydrolase [Spirochaetales bacterium]|nr:cellulase family glycosylhydrolase [Spirochaetales bacterium]